MNSRLGNLLALSQQKRAKFMVASFKSLISGLLKNVHLLRFPHPSPCQARGRLIAAYIQYASFLRISGALHLGIFEQPAEMTFSATIGERITHNRAKKSFCQ